MSHADNKRYLEQVEAYKKNLENAKKMTVAVGLPAEKTGGKAYKGGVTVVEVGSVHEFGSPSQGIPERSFLRSPIEKKSKLLRKFIDSQFRKVLEQGLDAFDALDAVGVRAQTVVLRAFKTSNDGEWRENKPKTKKRKGSDKTLVDSGILQQSITWITRRNK